MKEIFHTLQGEGANAGTAAVFCRFAGCNLWSGREEDRDAAVCDFCDTDFVGSGASGGKFAQADSLAAAIEAAWPRGQALHRFVVFTGGEPLLQLDAAVVNAVRARGFRVAIETNGTLPLPCPVDWVCVSPKAAAPMALQAGQELKLVFPQPLAPPERFESLSFEHFFLQPMDGPALARNTRAAIDYCLAHPRWRLSQQSHKVLGIP